MFDRWSDSERLRAAAEELERASMSIAEATELSTEPEESRLHPGGAGDSTTANSTLQHSHVGLP